MGHDLKITISNCTQNGGKLKLSDREWAKYQEKYKCSAPKFGACSAEIQFDSLYLSRETVVVSQC